MGSTVSVEATAAVKDRAGSVTIVGCGMGVIAVKVGNGEMTGTAEDGGTTTGIVGTGGLTTGTKTGGVTVVGLTVELEVGVPPSEQTGVPLVISSLHPEEQMIGVQSGLV